MTAFGGKSNCGLVESVKQLFNRLITFWIKEHCVVRIGSSFHQLQKDLRLAGWSVGSGVWEGNVCLARVMQGASKPCGGQQRRQQVGSFSGGK